MFKVFIVKKSTGTDLNTVITMSNQTEVVSTTFVSTIKLYNQI